MAGRNSIYFVSIVKKSVELVVQRMPLNAGQTCTGRQQREEMRVRTKREGRGWGRGEKEK